MGGLPALIQLGNDPIVIGLEYLANPCLSLPVAQADIPGNPRHLAKLDDGGLRARRSVAVDDEARIGLPDDECIQGVADQAGDGACADIRSDVTFELAISEPELAKPPGQALARVVAGNEERRSAAFVAHRERRRLVLRQKPARRLAQSAYPRSGMHRIA